MTKEQSLKILQVHASQLREQGFDSVQIFVTAASGTENTMRGTWGDGDWFARYGVVQYWLELEKERARLEAREEEE